MHVVVYTTGFERLAREEAKNLGFRHLEIRHVVRRGNPFFLEETVRMLVETNALAGERGRYRLTHPIQAIQVPPTVYAMLAARIDRLPSEDRPYLVQLPADRATSKDAAAAAVLATVDARTAGGMKVALASYLGVDPRWRGEIGGRQARRGRCGKGRGGAGLDSGADGCSGSSWSSSPWTVRL